MTEPKAPPSGAADHSPLHDLAHIAHAELLTPFADESLRFFVDLFGMQIEHRDGQSVFLRGWGEYQPYGLKLTESELPGLGHAAIRAWSPEALERRVEAIEAVGWASAGTRGITGTVPRSSSAIPTATGSRSSTSRIGTCRRSTCAPG